MLHLPHEVYMWSLVMAVLSTVLPVYLFGVGFKIMGASRLSIASMVILTGRFLATRRHHMFCLVIGCVECLSMPFGTVLGVFTIIVLSKESVKQLFAGPVT